MEKIKQALERARQERAQEMGNLSPPDTRNSDGGDAVDESHIQYTKTRVVSIDSGVFRRNKIVVGRGDDAAETAYKILRTQVEKRLVAQNWNAIAVTSPGIGQGKTVTAINLAVALAREVHRTVLLVDLDFRKPSIHQRFGENPAFGLVDYLLDEVSLSEILINPGIERLVLLPAGRSVANSSELLASPKMVRLVYELKARYASRIIVFDLPPLLSADDALAFSPYVDATLIVVEDGVTTKHELIRALEMMEGFHLLGTVLNKADDLDPADRYER